MTTETRCQGSWRHFQNSGRHLKNGGQSQKLQWRLLRLPVGEEVIPFPLCAFWLACLLHCLMFCGARNRFCVTVQIPVHHWLVSRFWSFVCLRLAMVKILFKATAIEGCVSLLLQQKASHHHKKALIQRDYKKGDWDPCYLSRILMEVKFLIGTEVLYSLLFDLPNTDW